MCSQPYSFAFSSRQALSSKVSSFFLFGCKLALDRRDALFGGGVIIVRRLMQSAGKLFLRKKKWQYPRCLLSRVIKTLKTRGHCHGAKKSMGRLSRMPAKF